MLLRDVLNSKDKVADSDKKNNALDAAARQPHCELLQSAAVLLCNVVILKEKEPSRELLQSAAV